MIKRPHIKKVITLALLLSVMHLTACGYFLYPERQGQKSGKLDSTVILLDAAGLLIGIIPGVVAFAVDIATGAIYLPKGGKSVIDKHLEGVRVQSRPQTGVDKKLLAAKLSAELNRPVSPEMIQLYGIPPDTLPELSSMDITVIN